MTDDRYSIYVINGDVFEWADDPYTPSLMFRELTWEKAVELAHLSFEEGYEVVIWRSDRGNLAIPGADDAEKKGSGEM